MQPINTVLRGIQPALIENVKAYWGENTPDTPHPTPSTRRHSRKGQAVGWIEERQGNKKRKHPSTSYYYRYYDSDGRKQQQYVQVHLMDKVSQIINQRCTVETVLQFIHTHSRYSGKLHHTQEPKV